MNLAQQTATDGFGDTDVLISIESVRGSQFGDSITGNAATNRLRGDAGNDTLNGADGNDRLEGGRNDQLSGGVGSDELDGGVGSDRLNGGAGNDVLTGGSGADRFVFSGKVGNDRITDFDKNSFQEKIDLSKIAKITDFNDLVDNHIGLKNGNIAIQIDRNNSIELEGITPDTRLAEDYFIF